MIEILPLICCVTIIVAPHNIEIALVDLHPQCSAQLAKIVPGHECKFDLFCLTSIFTQQGSNGLQTTTCHEDE